MPELHKSIKIKNAYAIATSLRPITPTTCVHHLLQHPCRSLGCLRKVVRIGSLRAAWQDRWNVIRRLARRPGIPLIHTNSHSLSNLHSLFTNQHATLHDPPRPHRHPHLRSPHDRESLSERILYLQSQRPHGQRQPMLRQQHGLRAMGWLQVEQHYGHLHQAG